MRRARLILVALSLAGCAGLGMQSSDNAASRPPALTSIR